MTTHVPMNQQFDLFGPSQHFQRTTARLKQTRIGMLAFAALYYSVFFFLGFLGIILGAQGLWIAIWGAEAEKASGVADPLFMGAGIFIFIGMLYYIPGTYFRERSALLQRVITDGTQEDQRLTLSKVGWFIAYLAQAVFLGVTMFVIIFSYLMVFGR